MSLTRYIYIYTKYKDMKRLKVKELNIYMPYKY